MKKFKLIGIAIFIGLVLLPVNCFSNTKKINIITTIQPQVFLVEKIGGDKVVVAAFIPPNADPHTFEPKPRQMKKISKADIYFKLGSGLEFEEVWLEKLLVFNSKLKLCNSGEKIDLLSSPQEIKDEEKAYRHEANDPHIWLSLANTMIIALNIRDALIVVDPKNEDYYRKNAKDFILEIHAIKTEIQKKLADLKNRKILVVHPSWTYFARDNKLEQIAVEIEGKEPSSQDLESIIELAKKNQLKTIITSPQFSRKKAQVIAKAVQAKIIEADPLKKYYFEDLMLIANALSMEE